MLNICPSKWEGQDRSLKRRRARIETQDYLTSGLIHMTTRLSCLLSNRQSHEEPLMVLEQSELSFSKGEQKG